MTQRPGPAPLCPRPAGPEGGCPGPRPRRSPGRPAASRRPDDGEGGGRVEDVIGIPQSHRLSLPLAACQRSGTARLRFSERRWSRLSAPPPGAARRGVAGRTSRLCSEFHVIEAFKLKLTARYSEQPSPPGPSLPGRLRVQVMPLARVTVTPNSPPVSRLPLAAPHPPSSWLRRPVACRVATGAGPLSTATGVGGGTPRRRAPWPSWPQTRGRPRPARVRRRTRAGPCSPCVATAIVAGPGGGEARPRAGARPGPRLQRNTERGG